MEERKTADQALIEPSYPLTQSVIWSPLARWPRSRRRSPAGSSPADPGRKLGVFYLVEAVRIVHDRDAGENESCVSVARPRGRAGWRIGQVLDDQGLDRELYEPVDSLEDRWGISGRVLASPQAISMSRGLTPAF